MLWLHAMVTNSHTYVRHCHWVLPLISVMVSFIWRRGIDGCGLHFILYFLFLLHYQGYNMTLPRNTLTAEKITPLTHSDSSNTAQMQIWQTSYFLIRQWIPLSTKKTLFTFVMITICLKVCIHIHFEKCGLNNISYKQKTIIPTKSCNWLMTFYTCRKSTTI